MKILLLNVLYWTKLIHYCNISHHRYTMDRFYYYISYHRSFSLLATNNLKRPTWNKKKGGGKHISKKYYNVKEQATLT